MEIYQAISFDKPIESGGSTYPWVIRVLTNEGYLVPYVVKLFTERQTEQQHPVAKEILVNRLAREFDLSVPKCALIEFSDEFICTLPDVLPDVHLKRFENAQTGLKFGSELASGMSIVKPDLPPSFLKEYDLGTIFAFDNLIQNLDRGGEHDKPNLLINDTDFLLIDHEQAFPFANDATTCHALSWSFDIPSWERTYKACYKHLFYPAIKAYRRETKTHLFDSFEENLRRTDFSFIDDIAGDLQQLGVSVGRIDLISDYLAQTQKQHATFIKLLQALIL